MFSVHNVPAEGQFTSPAKADTGDAAEETRLKRKYNAAFHNNPGVWSVRLLRNALH